MSFISLIPYIDQLWQGISVTLLLLISSLIVGALISIIYLIIYHSQYNLLMRFVDIIVYFFRGTPLLVQIFIIYFGSGEWLWLRESMMWPYFKEPFFCALLALSLNTAAYTFVIIKGAFYSIPYYEYEACRVLSMGKFQMMRYIIVPHVLRIIVPAYGNEVITMLQNTSLASTITLMDLTGVISQINSQTYATLEFLAIGGAIYLSLSSVITYFVKFVERRFKIVGVINLNKR